MGDLKLAWKVCKVKMKKQAYLEAIDREYFPE